MRICANVFAWNVGVSIFVELDQGSVSWKDMKVWSYWLLMKTAWFDSSRNSFFFPSFLYGSFLSSFKRICDFECSIHILWHWHIYINHTCSHIEKIHSSRWLIQGVVCHLLCIDLCNRRSMYSWLSFTHSAFHTLKHPYRHSNIHIINMNTLLLKQL